MTTVEPAGPFSATCPTRELLDQIADKWSVLILVALRREPVRFNDLKRKIEGITQKMLGQTLRRLERNGLVERHVVSLKPIAVEYGISPQGHSLAAVLDALRSWSVSNVDSTLAARALYDGEAQRAQHKSASATSA